jgi:hypothetical protein
MGLLRAEGELMPEATEAQKQILDEMQALVKAWVDRGLTYRDVVPLFATYLVTLSIQGGYSIVTIGEMIPRLWAHTMIKIIEAKKADLVEPPK